jgi:hypothetical protein
MWLSATQANGSQCELKADSKISSCPIVDGVILADHGWISNPYAWGAGVCLAFEMKRLGISSTTADAIAASALLVRLRAVLSTLPDSAHRHIGRSGDAPDFRCFDHELWLPIFEQAPLLEGNTVDANTVGAAPLVMSDELTQALLASPQKVVDLVNTILWRSAFFCENHVSDNTRWCRPEEVLNHPDILIGTAEIVVQVGPGEVQQDPSTAVMSLIVRALKDLPAAPRAKRTSSQVAVNFHPLS